MRISFANISSSRRGALVVTATVDSELSRTGTAVDKSMGGAIQKAMGSGRFSGKKGQVLEFPAPAGLKSSRVLVVGLGKAADVAALTMEAAGGTVVGRLAISGETEVAAAIDPIKGSKISAAEAAARFAYGANLGSYRFDRYRTKLEDDKKPSLGSVVVMSRDAAGAKKAYMPLDRIASGVYVTRDLVSEPANVKYAETIAADARGLRKLGVKVEVLGERRMQQMGMGALLGVNQGSEREAKLLVMQWNGAPQRAGQRPVAFIGKGVTFDTGGISIKPSGGMEDMKWDMAGAGAVIGVMHALAARKARANVVGVCGLVENMPSGTAQRPGDVVKSMSGQTVEVINTDAEGRLVLADALWYTQKRFRPQAMIDLATLTGAIIVSLGHVHAGLFSDNDELANTLTEAGKAEGETVWRLPIGDQYDKDINSDIADMKNVGAGRAAGSITAAQFLKRFANNVPWAHLDIAGMAWSNKARPTVPKGGTGFGVRLLDRWVADNHEVA
ncbi:MAG: leucyl aminopeptidase [Alphaproteobacteria bacterium]|nr:leucyl aminopeptidase [Alphaproteobacteria bacterium]